MNKCVTTNHEDVHDELHRRVGRRDFGKFVSEALGLHGSERKLNAGYRAMAADIEREADSKEWTIALAHDAFVLGVH